jgi:hypothetical protein
MSAFDDQDNTPGPPGVQGPAGSAGPAGPQGPQGAPGTARAYAYLNPFAASPGLDAARSKNFVSASNPSTGIWCLVPSGGVTEAGSAQVVSPEWANSTGATDTYLAYPIVGASDCAPGDFEVQTYSIQQGVTPDAWCIAIERDCVLSPSLIEMVGPPRSASRPSPRKRLHLGRRPPAGPSLSCGSAGGLPPA